MAPPAFADLGRASKDLLNKHHHAGFHKFNYKIKPLKDVDLSADTSFNNETSILQSAALETKYNIQPHGVIVKQKWSLDNIFTGEVSAEDYFARGLKAGLTGSFAPTSGRRNCKLTCSYKSPFFNLNSDLDFDKSGPVLTGAGVFGYLGWLAGMKMTFDPTKNKLSKSNFALSYRAPNFHVTGHVDDGQELNCSIQHKLDENFEGVVNIGWSSESSPVKFAVGGHYKVSKDSAWRVKFNSINQLHVSLIHRLTPNLRLTLSEMIDVKELGNNNFKYGFGLDYEY